MKKTLFLLLPFFISLSAFSQNIESVALSENQEKEALEVVDAWIVELLQAENVDKLIQLSDIPFALTNKKILTSKEELKKIYLQVFNNKGKQDIPEYESKIIEHKFEILDECIPLNFLKVRVVFKDRDTSENSKIICLSQKEDGFKVVGIKE